MEYAEMGGKRRKEVENDETESLSPRFSEPTMIDCRAALAMTVETRGQGCCFGQKKSPLERGAPRAGCVKCDFIFTSLLGP